MTVLGASFKNGDVTFSVVSRHAEAIDFVLFPAGGGETKTALVRGEQSVWSAKIPGARPGDAYALRVRGPMDPARGHRFDATKLLVDPYAKLIVGGNDPRSVLVDETYAWAGDVSPKTPWRDSLLYELHVRGFTRLMPDVPPNLRGTYRGLGSEAAIAHLRSIGVTAVELLPVHEMIDESRLREKGRVNYWGYNTLGFFAPTTRYATKAELAVREFRDMVKSLHSAGIEVILDVVYNHTCEGDETGPTVSLRGIDNALYYELDPQDPSRYANRAACGNTLNIEQPWALKLVMDSLRYWVTEMHVDGFRFDLATILGRERGRFDHGAAFFDIIHQDPVLADVKLIAEPWDATAEGFTLGQYPHGFREWNSYFRDDIRRFWNGYERRLGPLGYRLTGSSDVFGGRGPTASINFVTVHDGFTLRDLVTYEERHNEKNGENNRDGAYENFSANFGSEGPSDEPAVTEARLRQMRALLATLLLVPGVPMILAGDELGRSQRGNNNAYCLDDATSWVSWVLDASGKDMLEFTRRVSALRKKLATLRGAHHLGDGDVRWLRPDGNPMAGADWDQPEERGLTMVMMANGAAALAILVNGGAWPLSFTLPFPEEPTLLLNTAATGAPQAEKLAGSPSVYNLEPRSLAVVCAASLSGKAP